MKKRIKQQEKELSKIDAFDLYYNSNKNTEEIASIFNITTRTLYRWFNGIKKKKSGNQKPPKKKHKRKQKYPGFIFERILELKKENLHRKAPTIHLKIKEEFPDCCPSVHLIRKVLAGSGLNQKDPRGRKGYVKFERKMPNDLWQIDISGVQTLVGLGKVYLFALIDDCSRFIVSAKYFKDQRGLNVIRILRDAFEIHGRPRQILADNGSQFKNVLGELGTKYSRLLNLLDIQPIFARPNHPQTKGKLERWFGTVKNSFLREEKFYVEKHSNITLNQLNEHLDKWVHWYNFEKAHRSLPGYYPPAEIYFKHPKRIERPLKTIINWDRWLTISDKRKISKYNTISYKKEVVQIPEGYAGCIVEVLEVDDKLEVYYEDKCLMTYTIDMEYLRLKNKQFTRKIDNKGYLKYRLQKYKLDPMLAGKYAKVKEICNGKKIVVYIDDVLFNEFEKKEKKKDGE